MIEQLNSNSALSEGSFCFSPGSNGRRPCWATHTLQVFSMISQLGSQIPLSDKNNQDSVISINWNSKYLRSPLLSV